MKTTIETITVTRPMKVIAFTCCTITTFLMVGACASSEWIMTEGWREGLFQQCVTVGAPTPLPFQSRNVPGCFRAHNAGYVKGVAALIVVVCFTDLFGAILTGLGLRSTDPNKKYKYYRVAIYTLIICAIALLLALIIYPVSFSKEMETDKRSHVFDGSRVEAYVGSIDFDKDGIPDYEDLDDDNDGIPDISDPDDDNDGIPDTIDKDDDNDLVPDSEETFGMSKDNDDMDGDGIADHLDTDDDNDGIPDAQDNDDDNDGIPDDVDNDDDNDGIPDHIDNGDMDGDGIADAFDTDDDNDGIPDAEDNDDDGDGIPDAEDEDDDNDGIPDDQEGTVNGLPDSDGDGVPDIEDADDDNDGIYDVDDDDDNNNGIPDSEDVTGHRRVWSFGFGYGASWASFLLIFMSVVLLICDRESEEIFYKEKQVEDDEEEEEA